MCDMAIGFNTTPNPMHRLFESWSYNRDGFGYWTQRSNNAIGMLKNENCKEFDYPKKVKHFLLHCRASTGGTGNHPFYNPAKDIMVAQFGYIGNYFRLRKILESKGHLFNTDIDSESLLHIFEDILDESNDSMSIATGLRLLQRLSVLGRVHNITGYYNLIYFRPTTLQWLYFAHSSRNCIATSSAFSGDELIIGTGLRGIRHIPRFKFNDIPHSTILYGIGSEIIARSTVPFPNQYIRYRTQSSDWYRKLLAKYVPNHKGKKKKIIKRRAKTARNKRHN